VRDRAEAYAEGARQGAPAAQQVAARFHILQNASAALAEVLRGRRRRLEYLAELAPPATTTAEPAPMGAPKQQQLARRTRRLERWEVIRQRRAAGQSISQIARELGIERKTVRRHLGTRVPPPAPYAITPRPAGLQSPTLQPFVSYLQDRWQAGCHNVSLLYRELVARGYTASYSLLREALRGWRPPCGAKRRTRRRVSLQWLCRRPPEQRRPEEHAVRTQAHTADAELAQAYELLQQCRTVIRTRELAALDAWFADAKASELAQFVSLANGIEQDRAAVEAALTTPWSNERVAYCTSSPVSRPQARSADSRGSPAGGAQNSLVPRSLYRSPRTRPCRHQRQIVCGLTPSRSASSAAVSIPASRSRV